MVERILCTSFKDDQKIAVNLFLAHQEELPLTFVESLPKLIELLRNHTEPAVILTYFFSPEALEVWERDLGESLSHVSICLIGMTVNEEKGPYHPSPNHSFRLLRWPEGYQQWRHIASLFRRALWDYNHPQTGLAESGME